MLASAWVPNSSLWLLAILLSTSFFCNDLSMGPAWASCADIAERHAGSLSGAMNMTGAFFGAVAMSFAGALFHRHLDEVVFIAFACSYALAAVCWLFVDVTKPLVPKAEERPAYDPVYGLPTPAVGKWLARNPQLKERHQADLRRREAIWQYGPPHG